MKLSAQERQRRISQGLRLAWQRRKRTKMKWQSITKVVDAEQFLHPATAPRGVRTEEDGRAYVVTIQGQKVYIKPGEWIVEEPDREHYYPVADEVFRASYKPLENKKDWRIGLTVKPRLRGHALYYETAKVLDVLPSGTGNLVDKDGILKVETANRIFLAPASEWVTA